MSMVRNVSILMRGMIVAQIVGFIALPFLARLLPVTAFGQFQVYSTMLSIGLVLAAMRYELAVLRCRNPAELRAALHLCLLINLLVAVMAGVSYELFRAFGRSSIAESWAFNGALLATGLLLAGMVQTLGYVVSREEAFREGARVRETQAYVYAGSGLALGWLSPSQSGLIWADIGGRLAAFLMLLLRRAHYGLAKLRPMQPRRILAVARKYRAYAIWTVPSSLVGVLTASFMTMGVYSIYGPQTAGQFGLMERAVLLPNNLIVVAMSQVFIARLAKELREANGNARSFYRQTLVRLLLLGGIPALLVYLAAAPVFTVVFGPQWRLAGELATILAPFLLINFAVGSLALTLVVAGAQRWQVAWEIGRFAAMLLAWGLVLSQGLSIKAALALNYGVHVAAYLVYILIGDRVLKRHGRVPSDAAAERLEEAVTPPL